MFRTGVIKQKVPDLLRNTSSNKIKNKLVKTVYSEFFNIQLWIMNSLKLESDYMEKNDKNNLGRQENKRANNIRTFSNK